MEDSEGVPKHPGNEEPGSFEAPESLQKVPIVHFDSENPQIPKGQNDFDCSEDDAGLPGVQQDQ